MIKMFKHIILMVVPIFAIWVFLLAIRYNFDLSGVHINLYGTVKQFEMVSSADFKSYITKVVDMFTSLNFDFNFAYVEVNSITSFFQNIGVWFNGVFNIIVEFFKGVGSVIGTLGLGIAYIGRIIIDIVNFIFNPVVF